MLQERSLAHDRQPSKLQELVHVAHRLGCSPTQLTIAWCLKNEHVHCVLLGATSLEQLASQLQALQIVPKLTSAVTAELEKILDNKPIRTLPTSSTLIIPRPPVMLWSQEAYTVARQCNLVPPTVEQTEYHMFQREKVEIQLPELFHKIETIDVSLIGVGTVTWSPQAFGILAGKLDEGVHLLSRGSVKIVPKLTSAVTAELEKILDNKPIRTLPTS
ncbi:KCNAB1, partial [Cordylochernes scorpioides]